MKDYVAYIDTDSLYVQLYDWLRHNNINMDQWEKLTQEDQLYFIELIAKEVETYVNSLSIEETQLLHYNSQVEDFGITFEQEKIALTGIFKMKKRYATWTLKDEGEWKDSMSITGLEIIRSDSPEIVKPMIKKVLEMVLLSEDENVIKDHIEQCYEKLKNCEPSMIAENKGINLIDKYEVEPSYHFLSENQLDHFMEVDDLKQYSHKKGTPHQIKGAINFRSLMDKLKLEGKYEVPTTGNKSKIVYIKDNPYKIFSLSFLEWPKEFDDNYIQIDYDKMIENNFTKKIRGLLETVGMEHLLDIEDPMADFFT